MHTEVKTYQVYFFGGPEASGRIVLKLRCVEVVVKF